MSTNRYARPENFANRIRTPLLREHYVYRAFDDGGRLLYVGCSYDLPARLKAHKGSSLWHCLMASMKVAGPYNYETARQFEHDAIESERPQFNYTSEHRLIDYMRRRMIEREIAVRVAIGVDYFEAIHPAVDAVNGLIGDHRHRLIDDFTIPACRRIEREHVTALGGVA